MEIEDMTNSTKAHSSDEVGFDVEALAKDFAAMKHDIAAIAARFASSAGNGASDLVHDTADDLSERATNLYKNVSAQGKRAVGVVSHQVEERPLVSLLVAFAVGFVASKLLSRSS
jgi:ElaB/YqjD/DUF883 family membrane-anchored ribosome-binding protein